MLNVNPRQKSVRPPRGFVRILFLAFFCVPRITVAQLGTLPTDTPPSEPSATETSPDASSAGVRSVPVLAEEIKRSLVSVKVVGRDGRDASFATGFAISRDGLIATAFHSIAEGYGIAVVDNAGRELDVTHIHARLPAADLVVLQVAASDLTPLTFREQTPPDGLEVVAVGHPRGRLNSVVTGIISRRETIDEMEMLQLSMPIERGSSGEPVVDREGRVLGIVTLKSSVQDNTGFAVPVRHLQRMLQDPVPIPIGRWETIGRLDGQRWTVRWDANWRRRGTGMSVDGYGQSFGGRSLCLSQQAVPEPQFELQVDVRLENEDGAAGLVFHSDGGERHFGFYPSAGRLRVTRFSGPTVNSWTILKNEPQPGYEVGGWNTLKVRGDGSRFTFFLNGQPIYRVVDDRLPPGRVGLAVFRGTQAKFRRFRLARELPPLLPDDQTRGRIMDILAQVNGRRPAGKSIVEQLQPHAQFAARTLEQHARDLERQAAQIRRLAEDVHTDGVRRQLQRVLSEHVGQTNETNETNANGQTSGGADRTPADSLLQAALLVARLDHPDVDVDAYVAKVERIAADIREPLPASASRQQRLAALDNMMFRQLGFRGSRFEYYSQESSYLNQVIDDREGLPIVLCVLYMDLGRRLGVQMEGLGLPGHFIVRVPATDDDEAAVFIDVFNQGKRLTLAEIEALIASRSRPSAEFWKPQTPRQIVDRMLRNLLGLAEDNRADDAIFRYVETLAALDEANPEYRAKRMMIRAQTDRLHEAIEDVNWFIGNDAFAADLDQFYELRAEFERKIEQQQP